MFNVNFTYLLEILIPPILRKEKLRAWLKLISSQIRKIYDDFIANRTFWKYDINFTGQVCYLEKKLQEIFYCGGIKIIDGDMLPIIYLSNINENYLPVYATNISENTATMSLVNISEVQQTADFFVLIPICQHSIDLDKMRAIIDKYKLVEKNYKIIQ